MVSPVVPLSSPRGHHERNACPQTPLSIAIPPGSSSLYFVNGPVDFLLIGGVSLLVFALLKTFHSGERTVAVYTTAAALAWIVNWPHFSATSYRLYQSRENRGQYPMTALAVPWLVLAGVAGSLASPLIVAPFFVKVFLIWSPYHFSGQTLGISMIYARRAGFRIGRLERFTLASFIFGTFLSQTARSETGTAGAQYYGIRYPAFGLPDWVATAVTFWMYLMGAAFLVLALRWSLRERRLVPLMVLLPAAAQYVWFVAGMGVSSFLEFVPFFHSLQYLLIAWSMQLKERMDRESIAPSTRFVATESARWGLLNFAGGVCLFYLIPHAIAAFGLPLAFATGVFISGVQIHHFFVDGVIWKLRRTTVVSPLMVNLREMTGLPAAEPDAAAVQAA